MDKKWRIAVIGCLAGGILMGTLHAEHGRDSTNTACSPLRLQQAIKLLEPLHHRLEAPQPGDWRSGPGRNERGQTFAEYLKCDPIRPSEKRRTIYLLPIGTFTKTEKKILQETGEFLSLYYFLPVKTLQGIPDKEIPASARRVHPQWGMKQFLSTYILDQILKPRRPRDGLALFAITATDLWPGEGWNFVFGQASLRERVGVQSIYRNGQPDQSKNDYLLFLRRTLKTATHEMGHMLSMEHCIAWQCNMCGSNHREESDRRPLWLCPECMAKVCWAVQCDPIQRYERLADYCRKAGLTEEAKFYESSAAALKEHP
jgi:archaemetzincin